MGHALDMCIIEKEKKASENTRTLGCMYFKKNITLIEKEKNRILSDGMVMYVNERSLSLFFFSIAFSNRSSFSTTSMYIIISCFVRKRKRERERERGKEDCSVLSNRRICPLLLPSSSSFFLGSFENRTEKEKTQLIGGHI